MSITTRPKLRLRFTVFVAAALVLSLAAPAVAARNNNRGNKSPTLTISSMDSGATLLRSGAMPYGEMMIEGDGFAKNAPILIVFDPEDRAISSTDGSGSFDVAWMPDGPGTYTVKALHPKPNGQWVVGAETSVTITG